VTPADAYTHFRSIQNTFATNQIASLLDPSFSEQGQISSTTTRQLIDEMVLPAYKLKKLQEELDALEAELKLLEREELSSSLFGMESDSALQLQEIEVLRWQMRNVAESQPFKVNGNEGGSALETRQMKKNLGGYDEKIQLAVESMMSS
jgi:hypothetical protein